MKSNITGHSVLFVGDIHGNTDWEEIAISGLKNFCEIVFLGDYIDSFFISPAKQLYNLKNLILFIKKNIDKNIHFLLGNHDFAYINGNSGISGYQYEHAHEYRQLLQENIDFLKIAWGYTNPNTQKYTLATHAGLTYRFWTQYILPEFQEKITNKRFGDLPDHSRDGFLYKITDGKKPENLQIHETLNFLKDKELLWKVGSARGGSGTPGPLWADYTEFLEDPYPGINQIFGHTPKPAVTIDHNDGDFYACVDSWGNKKVASLVVTL
jgi:hypothetical protein